MFFKQSLKFKNLLLLVLSTTFILFFGCNNDHNFKEKEVVASLDYETECLEQISPHFDLYFDGLLAEVKLKESFECLYDGIDYFQNKVAQERPGYYSLKEVTNLLTKLISDTTFDINFYRRVFVLKTELFGGETEFLSKVDLNTLKVFLKDLEKLMLDLSPHIKVIGFGDGEISDENLEISLNKIDLFLNKWLLYNESVFSEDNLISILQDIIDDKTSAINVAGKSWYNVFDLLRNTKIKSVIQHSEKKHAISIMTEVLRRAVKFNLVLDKDWLNLRDNYLLFEKEVNALLVFLKTSLGENKWYSNDLLDFMRVIDSLDLLPESFDEDVQRDILRLLFDKYFPDFTQDDLGELTRINFNLVEEEWRFFKDFIRKTEQLEKHVGSRYPLVLSGDDPFSRLTRSAWPVLVEDTSDTLYVTDKQEDVEFNFRGLFHISWQVTAAKILINTYATDQERASQLVGLKLLEVRDAYHDVFNILLATGILDENSRGSWFRIFNEINLFIPSAMPDNHGSLIEAAEYLAYLFSGINSGDQIASKVELTCPSYDKACVEETFKNKSEDLFLTTPTLSDYFVLKPSEDSLDEWFKSFEFIAKLENNPLPYSSSHIFRGTIANQYVETIFRKFDLLKDDIIDFKDSEIAYGTFKEALKLLPQVKGTVAENDDEYLFSFFSFFIKEGRLPEFTSGGIPKREFTQWKRDAKRCQKDWEKYGEEKCGYRVDRSRILALLAFLTGIEFVPEEE